MQVVGVYAPTSMVRYLELESYPILYYKHYRKYIHYIYIFTHGCRQTPKRLELKEPFASAGPDAPTWSAPS